MTSSEAYELHAAMRQYGIPGVVAPVNPHRHDGRWMVVDEDGQVVTASVQARVAAARSRRPARGFILSR